MLFQSIQDPQLIALIQQGAVGVLATDTVYGVVCSAALPQSVARLYSLKHRVHKPGTIIAASVEQLLTLGVEESLLRRVEKWWPNPLSIETAMGNELEYLHQGTGRQALRVVSDPEVRQLLEQTGPLLTSSANQPGEPGATTIRQAQDYFGEAADFYVDSGDRADRPPSTIAKFADGKFEVVRQGAVLI